MMGVVDIVSSLKKEPRLLMVGLVVAVLVIGGVGWGIYKYRKVAGELTLLKSGTVGGTTTDPKEEQRVLVEQVGKLIALPEGELPTVATVAEPEKLRNQAFFRFSEKGDKVLVYTNAKKAILYRPSSNKIIDVAPVNFGNPEASGSAQVPASEGLKAILLNGTQTVGLTKKLEDDVKKVMPNLVVVGRDNAVKRDYAKSLVAVVKGDRRALAAELADKMGVAIGELPSGEATPSAEVEVVIIAGADR